MIKIENIGKVFNSHSRNKNEVLKNVSFELPDKGLICIYGKSGSGKTTLLNIIGGLDNQDTGKIYIDNQEISNNVDKVRNQNIGFIFQNYYLEKGYTIADIMRNAMLIAGFKDEKVIKDRSREVLELVDMYRFRNKQADALSGGQKQRVAIARALIKGADVILADEPTGNLDTENTLKVMDILKEISKTRLVVVVTHEITLIKNYADSYIQLVDGKLSDKDVIGEVYKYEVNKNNIYVDENTERIVSEGNVNVKFYGDPINNNEEIQVFTDKGKVFINASKNITILNNRSEKKLVFKGVEEESQLLKKEVPIFTKSTTKRNGRLFTLKNIFKSQKNGDNEKSYSVANIFKQIFIFAIAIVLCFFSLMSFEILRVNVDNKELGTNCVYVDTNIYKDLKQLDKKLYESVDFFETEERIGTFSYTKSSSLNGIKIGYSPKAIELDQTKSDVNLIYGNMPNKHEVLITECLANRIKNQFRVSELDNNESMLLVVFEDDYRVSGIVEGNSSEVYFPKEEYVNFLGVLGSIEFFDSSNIFFEDDYKNYKYTSEIVLDKTGLMGKNEAHIEINRNALYKMVSDVEHADYKIKAANSVLNRVDGVTGLEIKHSNMYVKKLTVTRDIMTTDIRVHISKEAMDNIFVFLEPDVNKLNHTTADGRINLSYYEIKTKDNMQLSALKQRLNERGIPIVNIDSQYERQNKDAVEKATDKLTVFYIIIALLFVVYFFIEKSGSIKNSKEYGIYRAIGVNKSNLLYKEFVLALANNMVGYLIYYLIVSIIMCVRYSIMNVVIGPFVGILAGTFIISSILMMIISIIPYTFVLTKTPSEILSKYDI